MPSSCDIENFGMDLSDVVRLQMEKIEELTLYLIDMEKKMNDIKLDFKK